LALIGVAERYKEKGDHIITCVTEHKAILDTCKYLEGIGKKITFLPVDKYGNVDLQKLTETITDRTILISIMMANNEIGTIAPMEEIGRIAQEKGILFHTDAAQAVGHIPVDVEKMHIDLMSISAHKVYGPKGIGSLYVRRRNPKVLLSPIIHGGGHERGIRSGTLNVPAIVGFAKALEIARREMGIETKRFIRWTNNMLQEFKENFKTVDLNGHPIRRLPHNLNVYFQGIESKAVIQSVGSELALSAGSACTSDLVEPSHVLVALGFGEERAYSSLRFGLGRFNTDDEIEYAIQKISHTVKRLTKIRI
jgi:cysteine desulfurase